MTIQTQLLLAVMAPLVGAIIAGLLGKKLGKVITHRVTITGVAVSFAISVKWFFDFLWGDATAIDLTIYEWASFGQVTIQIGFLLDSLTSIMMLVVTFVSLMVHIYSIGYMHDDKGYQRFFSYISLFTFSMLMLVMSNNFLQLFFGWEAVGVVSYLLIGFWYQKETAIFANMKAFLVNRVGDFGFLLGIGAIFLLFGTFDYAPVFKTMGQAEELISLGGQQQTNALALTGLDQQFKVWGGVEWSAISFVCICLFIGAMGKSAQVPLHVWLPDSMEGPTPISALIHAATMVTAGVFMVARMSPLFEFSETALAMVTLVGAITALFMGLVAIVQNDIKRIIAYSTLSQLGYMVVALGVSAYSAAIFHLFTHAFFKALLFLGAGSVIVALHHEQDIRKMGGLYKKLPITYWCTLAGTLALIGTPFFSGFYSKDTIISAVSNAEGGFSSFAYFAVLTGVVVTAIYSIRMLLIVFHGKSRLEPEQYNQLQESPKVITWPLIALAIPSLAAGFVFGKSVLFTTFFNDSITVLEQHNVLSGVREHYDSAINFALHGMLSSVFIMLIAGIVIAIVVYGWAPRFVTMWSIFLRPIKRLLERKYFFDEFNQRVFARGSYWIGKTFWRYGDKAIIDEGIIDGGTQALKKIALKVRKLQTGYLFHYALFMLVGLVAFLGWLLFKG
ncbi:NADH-quinone oxidoreductase subunit L [Kangiella sediminilitoris]|uniref:Proton-translocating NADH-quinone oxidoreductase, chain L n=1 Tax=Kangiella sediminilitoris TaxID=1144748 RepID=A0A1B3BDA5_9GAMM|nr:NADH-quinone oxidoreductase subunit L [Kangiella sediminilitoris]AOE50809.1 Proton-translocating NADH-quinone oxidoreductase, chain L [Kangiella sediminilitoris]